VPTLEDRGGAEQRLLRLAVAVEVEVDVGEVAERLGDRRAVGEEGARALRGLEWTWDPAPTDDTYLVGLSFTFRGW
jgi:hypothetical protein